MIYAVDAPASTVDVMWSMTAKLIFIIAKEHELNNFPILELIIMPRWESYLNASL